MENRWYVAKLILQCRVGDDDSGPWTCDEQIRVINATDDDQAYEKALRIGKGQEHNYQNVYSEIVRWSFIGLNDLERLDEDVIKDGTEITSRLLKTENPSSLVTPKKQLSALYWQSNPYRSESVASCVPEIDIT